MHNALNFFKRAMHTAIGRGVSVANTGVWMMPDQETFNPPPKDTDDFLAKRQAFREQHPGWYEDDQGQTVATAEQRSKRLDID